jgi:hypothetical protein
MSKSLSDADLDAGLDEAKKKPRYFAIITKGQTIVKMIVQKKRIKEGDIQYAKREFKGNAQIAGVCTRSGSELILQVENEEPTLKAIKVKEFITEQTGATVKPQWQVVAALSAVPDDDDEIAAMTRQFQQPAPSSPPYEDSVPAATKQEAAPLEQARRQQGTETTAKNETPTGYADANVGHKPSPSASSTTNQPTTTYSTQQSPSQATASSAYSAATTNTAASKAPPSNETKPEKVKRALKEIKSKINKAIEVRDPKKKPPLASPAPPGTPNSDEAPYRAQILELVARIKDLLNDKSRDRSDEAMSVFRELVAVVRTALQDRGEVAQDATSDRTVMLQTSRLDWDSARKRLHADLQRVAAAVIQECGNPDEYDIAHVKERVKELDALLEALNEDLIVVLDQALNAADASSRTKLEQQAIQLVQQYTFVVENDPLVEAVDNNGLVNVSIRDSMSKVLKELDRRLAS